MERCQITSECYRKSISGHSGHFRPAPADFPKFCLFKNVEISAVFAVTCIKRKNNEWLLTNFQTSILYGENKDFQKALFYHLYLQNNLNVFGESKICLYYCDFDHSNFVHVMHTTYHRKSIFTAKILNIKLLSESKRHMFDQN